MYELGFFASLFLSFAGLIPFLMDGWSHLGSNLARIGLRASIFSGEIVPMGNGGALGRLSRGIGWIIVALLTAVLSWVGVAIAIGTLVHKRSKRIGMPPEVAEFTWRLKNTAMTVDELNAAAEQLRQRQMRRNGAPEMQPEIESR